MPVTSLAVKKTTHDHVKMYWRKDKEMFKKEKRKDEILFTVKFNNLNESWGITHNHVCLF